MANEEHKLLAQYIKEVHASLRKDSYKIGVQKAWQEHCKNEKVLSAYAKCMEQLATIHWEKLRIEACKRAYYVLKPGGLLIINTPDSKHVGANSKLMKCWRYTLACLGFSRIKYEKFKHMHCLAFRKSLDKEIPRRWVKLCKEPYMEFSLKIPQDFLCDGEDENMSDYSSCTNCVADMELFEELPFNLNCDA
ncbi:unnamed protein product [Parnassius apollo]|uniref:(apollo) hypothetical protein n=1 Tax=Parnassius apollo TaxID=110799 RepID=A0A8S3XZM2_PARAO|nr:unnamed protein product [Parnassius apollo]